MIRIRSIETAETYVVWVRRFLRALGSDAGGALIETYLVLPILAVMLLGVMEIGMAEYQSIEVSNAARAGVQYGAQGLGYVTDLTGIRSAATNDAPNVTLGTTNAVTTLICDDDTAPTGSPLACANGGPIETVLKVTTRATFTPLIHIPGITSSITLNGWAIQKVSQ
jgi:Flp pilus assembly protein TadG